MPTLDTSLLLADSRAATVLAGVITAIGHADFPKRLGEACAHLTAAQQVTAFSIEGEQARCLIAHRPGQSDLVTALCQDYAAHHHSRDGLLRSCMADGREFLARGLRSEEIPDRSYREHLFGHAGLAA